MMMSMKFVTATLKSVCSSKSVFALLISVVMTGSAFAVTQKYLDEEAGVYVIDVPEGETYQITGTDVNAIGSNPLAKRGLGTLKVGGSMGSFTGEIRIEEGVYSATKDESLGTSAGGTVISNGATLKLECNTKDLLAFEDQVTIFGTVQNSGGVDQQYVFSGPVVLGGDAEFKGQTIGIKDTTLALNGHKLTVDVNKSAMLKFADVESVEPGDIDVLTGRLHLEGRMKWEGGADNRVSIAAGAMLGMREAKCDMGWTLDLADDAVLYPTLGNINEYDGNNWPGPVHLRGKVDVKYKDDSSGTYVRIDGPVSGPGSFVIGYGTWLKLSNPGNSFAGGVDVSSGMRDSGLVLMTNGALPVDGTNLTIRSGSVHLSAPETYDLPHVEVTSGGALISDVWGYGGTVAKLTKWGANVFDFAAGLAVTGSVQVGKATLRLSDSSVGTPGLTASVTNFLDQKAWEAFRDAASGDFHSVATNLLAEGVARGFAKTVLSPEDAYRQWGIGETHKMGVYSGCLWNNDATNKVCTFAASIADTEGLWINGKKIFLATQSKKNLADGTHFISIGETVLTPGPNQFMFLLGRHKCGTTTGTRDDLGAGTGVSWEKCKGIMYREGGYGAPAVTNSSDFLRIEDSGNGMVFTLTKDPSGYRIASNPRLYRPRFCDLIFGRDREKRCSIDIGGMDGFVQDGFSGCPYVTNGIIKLTGSWRFDPKDLSAHPVEVACDGGIVFDDATLDISVASYPRGDGGTVILRAEPGATVAGLPTVSASDPGIAIWEVKREERDGQICLVLYGRLRGTVISFR